MNTRSRTGRWGIWCCVTGILLFTIMASFSLGSRNINIEKVIHVLAKHDNSSFDALVILERIPRTIVGILAGSALGIAGALMQAITRNPVADPGVLGVNMGASLFVVAGIAFFHMNSAKGYILFALVGAGIAAILVYLIGSMGPGGTTPIKLALAGTAISAALSSLVSAILLPRTEVMNSFRFWQVGSLSGANWESIVTVMPFLLVGTLLGIFSAKSLNAMALGDEVAVGLGVNVKMIRLLGTLAGVILCGSITAIAGPIGYVGLIIPHLVRFFAGADLRFMIPLSGICGASLLLIADVIGRLIGHSGELEAGVVTAFLGAPVLIYLAGKRKGSAF